MVKFNYSKLSDAFNDCNCYYKEELKELPNGVWKALDDYFNESEIDVSTISDFFDNLYVNNLVVDDINEVDEERCVVLYVDDNNVAYFLV